MRIYLNTWTGTAKRFPFELITQYKQEAKWKTQSFIYDCESVLWHTVLLSNSIYVKRLIQRNSLFINDPAVTES